MPPIRVLYLVTELDPGGAERQLAALASGLDRKAFDPAVASLAAPGAMAKPLREAGIPVFSVAAKGVSDLKALGRLKTLLADLEPDLLHTFLFHANVAGRLCARLAGLSCPVVASVRVEDPRRLHRWGEKATARWADAFVANSKAMTGFLEEGLGLPAPKIHCIPNAALPLPEVTEGAFRKSLGIPEDTPLVVAAGRLDRQKGFDVLLKALPPDCTLALVGEGPETASLKKLAAGKDVRFTGRLPSAVPALADADLVVLPSRWEGMPNVALEALQMGKPILGTTVGGLRELLEGGAGVLVPPGDVEALRTALCDLLTDPARRAALGRAARIRAARYTVPGMVQAHQALYRRLLAARREAAA